MERLKFLRKQELENDYRRRMELKQSKMESSKVIMSDIDI
jgi:hypothetical protein